MIIGTNYTTYSTQSFKGGVSPSEAAKSFSKLAKQKGQPSSMGKENPLVDTFSLREEEGSSPPPVPPRSPLRENTGTTQNVGSSGSSKPLLTLQTNFSKAGSSAASPGGSKPSSVLVSPFAFAVSPAKTLSAKSNFENLRGELESTDESSDLKKEYSKYLEREKKKEAQRKDFEEQADKIRSREKPYSPKWPVGPTKPPAKE